MNNTQNQPKVSANDLMATMLETHKAATIASRNTETTNKSVIDLTKKVNALQATVSQNKKPRQSVQTAKGETAVMILLMILSIAVAVAQFVPQISEYLSFITADMFQWINIGCAVFVAIISAVAKVNRPTRFFAVLFGIAPLVASSVITLI